MAEALVADLHPYLARKYTRFETALCVRKIVYMSVDRLANIGPWHKFNEDYAVGKASAIWKLCCFAIAVVAIYMPDDIRWPTPADGAVRSPVVCQPRRASAFSARGNSLAAAPINAGRRHQIPSQHDVIRHSRP